MAEAPDIKRLGRYDIELVLGKGAMGVVYGGVDPRLHRKVAIKTILKSALDPDTAKEYSMRFVREAQAVARLNQANIVQVYDFGEEGDIAYIVMEFIKGKELKNFFDAGERFETKEAVRIMCELCDALHFAHEANIIHRDIKPANVMIDSQGKVKLADFGVARITDASSTERTQAGTMVGTPAYMSPEQITGGNIDRRTDIFSAGIILYQFLTGERPFTGAGAWTIAKKIIQDDPPLPSTINKTISPLFDAVVSKALSKTVENRYQTARDFGLALKRALEGKGDEDGSDKTIVGSLVAPPMAPPSPQAAVAAADGTGTRAGTASGTQEVELEFWRAIKDGNDPDDFELYVEQFPTGIYAALAKRKIAKLKGVAPEESGAKARAAAEQEKKEMEEAAAREEEVRKKLAEEKAKLEETLAKREAEYKQREAEAEARRQAEAAARAEAEAKREAEYKQREAEAEARRQAQEKARAEADAKREAELKARMEAEAKARKEELEKARKEAEALAAKREAEAKARLEAEVAKREAEAAAAKARAEAEAKARHEAEEKAKKEAEERARRQAEELARTKAEAEARAKKQAEEFAKQKAEADALAKKEAEERAKREAEHAKREADLKKKLAEAPKAKLPVMPIIAALIAIAGVGGGAYWYLTAEQRARQATLIASLEVATKAAEELKQAQTKQLDALKALENARAAEDAARKSGDMAKLKEAQEAAKRAEAEAAKQAELVKQREAAAEKARRDAADAKKKVDEQAKKDDTKRDVAKQPEPVKTPEKVAKPEPTKVPVDVAKQPEPAKAVDVARLEAQKAERERARQEALQKKKQDEEEAQKLLSRAEQRRRQEEKEQREAEEQAKKQAEELAEKARQQAKAKGTPTEKIEVAVAKPPEVLLFEKAQGLESSGDIKQALRAYRQAAKAGSGRAAMRLGGYYGKQGTPEYDYQESLSWYKVARDLGEKPPCDPRAASCK